MSEAISIKDVFDELKSMKKDIGYIKEHMIDPDTIMTAEENERFEQSMNEQEAGKTTSLTDIKKELRI